VGNKKKCYITLSLSQDTYSYLSKIPKGFKGLVVDYAIRSLAAKYSDPLKAVSSAIEDTTHKSNNTK
jgi:hypothetical protein